MKSLLTKPQPKDFEYIIGIDPGVITGIACYDRPLKTLYSCLSCTILEAMDGIRNRSSKGALYMARVEDARLRTWIPRQKDLRAELGRAQGAGSIKRDCSIWEEFLTREGIPFEMVAPKNNKTKITAQYFQKLTGWTYETNEHARDAAMLCYGF